MKKRNTKALLALPLFLMLLLCTSAPVFAIANPNSPVEPPPAGGREGEASTFAELCAWLNNHRSTGGTLTITQDIVADADYEFSSRVNCPEITLSFGEHRLYVEASLRLVHIGENQLKIKGSGDSGALVQLRKGGYASFFGLALEAKADGYALWQEEGSFLEFTVDEEMNTNSAQGKIHYAETISAWFDSGPDWQPAVMVEKDKPFSEQLLPTQLKVVCSWQGESAYREVPVIWDSASGAQALENRQRTELRGYPASGEYTAYRDAALLVVFNDYPATFTQCWAQAAFNGPGGMVFFNFTLPAVPCSISLEVSPDGENWSDSGVSETYLEPSERFGQFSPYWEELRQLYFRLRVESETFTAYSDLLHLTGDKVLVAREIDGNRGGGTSLGEGPSEGGGPAGPEDAPPSQQAGPAAAAASREEGAACSSFAPKETTALQNNLSSSQASASSSAAALLPQGTKPEDAPPARLPTAQRPPEGVSPGSMSQTGEILLGCGSVLFLLLAAGVFFHLKCLKKPS